MKIIQQKLLATILFLLPIVSLPTYACELKPEDYNLPEGVDFTRHAYLCGFNEGLASVNNGKKIGYIDKKGTFIIPMIYDNADVFVQEGVTRVHMNGKMGVVNTDNKIIVPIIYDFIEKLKFSNGAIEVLDANGKYGLYDVTGKLLVPVEYDDIRTHENSLNLKKGDKWGISDKQGNVIVPVSLNYKYIDDFEDDLASVRTYQDKHGFINTKGELVIEATYEDADSFDENLAIVSKFRDSNDSVQNYKITLPSETPNESSEKFWQSVEKSIASIKYGVINKSNEIIIPIEFDSVSKLNIIDVNDGYIVIKDNKKGVIKVEDGKQKQIVPVEYDSINRSVNEFIPVKQNEKWGLFNKKGTLVLPVQYDYIEIDITVHNFVVIEKDGKHGAFDEHGRLILKAEFDEITSESNFDDDTYKEYLVAKKDGQTYCYDSSGQLIETLKK